MGLEIGIALLEKIFFFTTFVGQLWIAQLVIIIASMALITRKAGDWKTLALPVMAGWQIFGMNIPYIFYAIGVILFVIDIISLNALGSAMSGIGNTIAGNATKTRRENRKAIRTSGRINIAEEMQRLKEGNARFETYGTTSKEEARKRQAKLDLLQKQKDLEIKKGIEAQNKRNASILRQRNPNFNQEVILQQQGFEDDLLFHLAKKKKKKKKSRVKGEYNGEY